MNQQKTIIPIVSFFDKVGGACRASYRLWEALNNTTVNPRLIYASDGKKRVVGHKNPLKQFLWFMELKLRGRFKFRNPSFHSFNLAPSPLLDSLNAIPSDIVHLHWIGNDTLALSDLAKIKAKHIIWTLHDEWAYAGAEHSILSNHDKNYVIGYSSGMNLKDRLVNRFVWKIKRKYYKQIEHKLHIIAPSQWILDKVAKSPILNPVSMHRIPNAINTDTFKPQDRILLREKWGIPKDKKLILFGAVSATSNSLKGYRQLIEALSLLDKSDDIIIGIYGADKNANHPEIPFNIFNFGYLDDDNVLAEIFALTDVAVVPSIVENAPQAMTEALACGTPVVAFAIGGIPEYIIHQKTGYLAEPFSPAQLAEGIQFFIDKNKDEMNEIRLACQASMNNSSYTIVAQSHIALYNIILSN